MKQFQFHIIKGTQAHSVFCTAQSVAKALRAVEARYSPQFVINALPVAIHNAHHFYCEIDASA